MPPEWKRIARFAAVGLVNTGVDLGVFSLLFYTAGLPLLAANSAAYIAAATNSFFANKHWTFAETRRHGRTHRQFVVFLLLGLVGLGLSNGVVWALAYVMDEFAAKLLSILVLFVWNFATSRLIVFRGGETAHP